MGEAADAGKQTKELQTGGTERVNVWVIKQSGVKCVYVCVCTCAKINKRQESVSIHQTIYREICVYV